MMMNAATMQVSSAPASVSHLPKRTSWMSRPLSTTELCWKKICHGVIVVPMFASRMKIRPGVNPPGISGFTKPSSTLFQPGAPGAFMAHRAAGM